MREQEQGGGCPQCGAPSYAGCEHPKISGAPDKEISAEDKNLAIDMVQASLIEYAKLVRRENLNNDVYHPDMLESVIKELPVNEEMKQQVKELIEKDSPSEIIAAADLELELHSSGQEAQKEIVPKDQVAKVIEISTGKELTTEGLINRATSFDDLISLIGKHQISIQGSIQTYDTDMLIDIVQRIRSGTLDTDQATTRSGFRDKIIDLLEAKEASDKERLTPEERVQKMQENEDKKYLDQISREINERAAHASEKIRNQAEISLARQARYAKETGIPLKDLFMTGKASFFRVWDQENVPREERGFIESYTTGGILTKDEIAELYFVCYGESIEKFRVDKRS